MFAVKEINRSTIGNDLYDKLVDMASWPTDEQGMKDLDPTIEDQAEHEAWMNGYESGRLYF